MSRIPRVNVAPKPPAPDARPPARRGVVAGTLELVVTLSLWMALATALLALAASAFARRTDRPDPTGPTAAVCAVVALAGLAVATKR